MYNSFVINVEKFKQWVSKYMHAAHKSHVCEALT